MSGWSADRLRRLLIALIAVAAVLSIVGKKESSPVIGGLSFAVFLGAVVLYAMWRRTALAERRAGRVFDREAKTDETRAGPDQ